jgi:alanyl-tRNA synthetase
MTDRLYYSDAYLKTFDAVVLGCDRQGDRFDVTLNASAFYPTSGGQPHDLGALGEARVHEVVEREDGQVVHTVDRPLGIGTTVRGEIDWLRRFDHMQQHTGQHVLSAAFDRLVQARTESFHLGRDASSIDLAREVSASEIAAVEDDANRIVWDDRPVHIRFATADEVKSLPLRKETLRSGRVRLIEVEDYDLSACGGTHVARTGAIGVIAIAGWERFKGGSRIQFLCGGRGLARFREWRDAFAATGRHLSVPPAELAAAVEKLQIETKTLQKTLRAQQEQLAVHEARALVSRARPVSTRLVLVDVVDGRDAPALKALASAATAAEPRLAVALFNTATPPVAIIAAGAGAGVDAAAVLKTLATQYGGKGGGRPELAQGGGFVKGTAADLLAAAAAALGD